jgi:hypothetical protein
MYAKSMKKGQVSFTEVQIGKILFLRKYFLFHCKSVSEKFFK